MYTKDKGKWEGHKRIHSLELVRGNQYVFCTHPEDIEFVFKEYVYEGNVKKIVSTTGDTIAYTKYALEIYQLN